MVSHLLLVAYDPECPHCRAIADWARARDASGLMVFFPIQNHELLRMAPELGGLPLSETIYGVDASTRRVFSAGGLWLQMALRMPGWRLLGLVFSLPGLHALAMFAYKWHSKGRCRVGDGRR
jgi:predicted DCC family thiol-disulfide oxidoreductase YuxK